MYAGRKTAIAETCINGALAAETAHYWNVAQNMYVGSNMDQHNSLETSFTGNRGWPRTRVRAIALALLAAVGIYLCYRLAQPCIPSLVWAGALALIFTPLQRWFEAKVRRPSLAAAFSLIMIGLLVVVPATWFAQKIADQATSVPDRIHKQIAAGKWHMNGEHHPQLAHIVSWVEREVNSPENASKAAAWLKAMLSRLVKESAMAAVQVSLTLYFLFYFLRDRVRVVQAIRSFLPLSDGETNTLFCRVNDTIHAILRGMLALSALQGLLGGLMFWALGLPVPWFWALVAAVFAFVPVIDTFVLWLPAAVYLGLEGRWVEALVVAALGSLLVRALENFLYPVLVKDRLKVPSESIFVSLVGGLVLFGWTGLVLGPVILTTTSALMGICSTRFGDPKVPSRSQDCIKPDATNSTTAEQTLGAAVIPTQG